VARTPPPPHNFEGTPHFDRGPYAYALTDEEAESRVTHTL
jgi:hypothetical protein